jgi:hypothetical protein
MSTLPPNIDAILASIRSRMIDGDAPAPPLLVETPHHPIAPADIAPTETLGEIIVAGQARTLEEVVRGMLEPMLKAWLDANMPEIVEKMAQAEIRRLTGRS